MRINWFCPLPPARSGIAEYSAGLLPELSRRAELVLWVHQDRWDRSLDRYGQVVPYAPPPVSWRLLNSADLTVYHIGNNADIHGTIWEISRRHPGLVILHDLRLHDFISYYYRVHKRDREAYLDHMGALYGADGRRDGELFWENAADPGYMSERYPLTPLVLDNALGLVVHNREALSLLPPSRALPIACLPLPCPALPERPRSRAPGPPFRLLIFGHIGKNRRLEPLLEAWAGLEEKERFRLDICGEVPNAQHIQERIEALGLRGLATLHGYVPDEVLEGFLAQAHLAVNLRHPTMGEASLSQLMIWRHALPSLVIEAGWYAALPPETVCFVRRESEMEDLRRHLRALVEAPAAFEEMGRRGHELLLLQHRPETYAAAVIDFAAICRSEQARAAARYAADRVGSELRYLGAGALSGFIDAYAGTVHETFSPSSVE